MEVLLQDLACVLEAMDLSSGRTGMRRALCTLTSLFPSPDQVCAITDSAYVMQVLLFQ